MENDPGKGVLFRNDHKKGDNHPDVTGFVKPLNCPHCDQEANELEVGGWYNVSKDSGKKYIRLKVSEKYKPSDTPAGRTSSESDSGWGL